MKKYIVREVQNLQSHRSGIVIWARSHTHAKILATRSRVYKGTILRLENEREVLLYLKENGKWKSAFWQDLH